MNTTRTYRRALAALVTAGALATATGSATAAPGMSIPLPLVGCTGSQAHSEGNFILISGFGGHRGHSTGYCHWQANAPAGMMAVRAGVGRYKSGTAQTGSRSLRINGIGAGGRDCWNGGRVGDGVADGRAIQHGFAPSPAACIVMAQDRDFTYGTAIFTEVRSPQMWVEDTQGPAVSAPRISGTHVSNGWIRPASQPQSAPDGPVAASAQSVTITVEWDSSDNEAFRGDTGVTAGGQQVNIGTAANGVHRADVTVSESTPISVWRAAPGWDTHHSAPRRASEMGVRIDSTPPVLASASASYDQGDDRIRSAWSATDANGDSGSDIAWSELQIAPQGSTTWRALSRVSPGQPTAVAPEVGNLDEGVYLVRIVARDRAGNWQVLPAGSITIARPAVPAPGAAGSASGGTSGGTSAGSGAVNRPAGRTRQTRYTIAAEFAQGNARQTTVRNARRGVVVSGELLDGYGDPVASTEIRIQQSGRVWKTTTDRSGRFTIRVTTGTRGVLGATAENVRRPMRLYVR